MSRFLTDKTKELLKAPAEERIDYVWKDKWIQYKAAEDSLKHMQRLIDIRPTHRPKNILLLGATNNGKTMILEQLSKNNPAYYIKGEDHHRIPCLKIQAPFKPSPKIFYNKILDSLFYPHKPQQGFEVKERQVYKALKTVKTRLLIIDEVHHALGGSANQQREFLNCIKNLSNELRISIVAAGTSDAFHVINSDPQIANRFQPFNLNRWVYGEEYVQLLYTLEGLLPLPKESKLYSNTKAKKILSMSEGYIGEITMILKEAFTHCMDYELDSISINVLDEINYVSPSLRRKLTMIG